MMTIIATKSYFPHDSAPPGYLCQFWNHYDTNSGVEDVSPGFICCKNKGNGRILAPILRCLYKVSCRLGT